MTERVRRTMVAVLAATVVFTAGCGENGGPAANPLVAGGQTRIYRAFGVSGAGVNNATLTVAITGSGLPLPVVTVTSSDGLFNATRLSVTKNEDNVIEGTLQPANGSAPINLRLEFIAGNSQVRATLSRTGFASGAATLNEITNAGAPLELPVAVGEARNYTVTNVSGAGIEAGVVVVTVDRTDLTNLINGGVDVAPVITITSSDGTFNNTPVTITQIVGNTIIGTVVGNETRQGGVVYDVIITLNPDGTITVTFTRRDTGQSVNGSGNQGGNQINIGLNNGEIQRINRAVAFLDNVGPVLSSWFDYVHENRIPADGTNITYSTEPVITVVRSGNTLNLTFNFGSTGSFSPNTGFRDVRGIVDVVYNINTGVGTFTFRSGFSVDNQTINGTMTVTLSPVPTRQTGAAFVTLNLSIGSIGSVTGTINIAFAGGVVDSGTFTVSTNPGQPLTLSGDTLALASAIISPITNGNYLPQSGTATIVLAGNRTVVLTFQALTPSQGKVTATLNGSAITFNLTVPD